MVGLATLVLAAGQEWPMYAVLLLFCAMLIVFALLKLSYAWAAILLIVIAFLFREKKDTGKIELSSKEEGASSDVTPAIEEVVPATGTPVKKARTPRPKPHRRQFAFALQGPVSTWVIAAGTIIVVAQIIWKAPDSLNDAQEATTSIVKPVSPSLAKLIEPYREPTASEELASYQLKHSQGPAFERLRRQAEEAAKKANRPLPLSSAYKRMELADIEQTETSLFETDLWRDLKVERPLDQTQHATLESLKQVTHDSDALELLQVVYTGLREKPHDPGWLYLEQRMEVRTTAIESQRGYLSRRSRHPSTAASHPTTQKSLEEMMEILRMH